MPRNNITIKELLRSANIKLYYSEIESYQLNSQILLEFILKENKEYILRNQNKTLNNKIITKYKELLIELLYDKPISKITNKREFYSYNFFIDENVLDPRNDSEILVETVNNYIQNKK